MLKPHIEVIGEPGPRPTVLLFHSCGGVRAHLFDYAAAAARLGLRAAVIDSYAARGWSKRFGMTYVCTGMRFWGAERAGDVLAAAHGAIQDLDADPDRLLLAGWSHGAWSIMDLMTMPLRSPGEAGLADPSPTPLNGLKGLFLAYPYGGVAALSRRRTWRRRPRTFGVLAERDLITTPEDSDRLYAQVLAAGVELELWRVRAPHCFDEPGSPFSWLRYDRELAATALGRFSRYLEAVLAN